MIIDGVIFDLHNNMYFIKITPFSILYLNHIGGEFLPLDFKYKILIEFNWATQ